MRKLLLGAALLLSFYTSLPAQYARMYLPLLTPPLPEVRRVTSHPQNDLDPAVSPDGRWLVFVSDRAGNRDIWIKPVAGGTAYPLTTHQADDYSPCWGTDNHTIYFISTRSDAEGDLWEIHVNPSKLPNTKITLTQLDDYLGYDGEPACSPVGNWLAYTSTRGSNQRNVWLFNRRRRMPYPFTCLGGFSPAWSADGHWLAYVVIRSDGRSQSDLLIKKFESQSLKGELLPQEDRGIPITDTPAYESFPVWALTGEHLFFLSHESDSNRDGRIDLEDNPSLVCVNLPATQLDSLQTLLQAGLPVTAADDLSLQHLTPADRYALFPAVTRSHLYLACREKQQFDIWELPLTGMIPKFPNSREQSAWIDSTFPPRLIEQLQLDQDSIFQAGWQVEQQRFNSLRLLALQSLLERFPDSRPWNQQAILTLAAEWLKSEQRLPTLRLLRQLWRQAPNSDSIYIASKILFWQAIGVEQENQLDSLAILARQFPDHPELKGKMALLAADNARSEGRLVDAETTLQQTLAQGNLDSENFGRLLATLSQLYREGQQYQQALTANQQLLQSATCEYWRQVAVQNIMQLLKESSPEQNEMTILQNASSRFVANRYLAAELQLRLAEWHWQQHDIEQALTGLDQIDKEFPEQKLANLKAANLTADIYRRSNRFDAAITVFQRLLQRTDLQNLERSYLKAQIRTLQWQIAQQLQRQQDFQAAAALYRTLLQEDSSQIEAHRGLIYCSSVQQQLPALYEEYLHRLWQNPNDTVILYCLGLICSDLYLSNPRGLLQANQYLEQALANDYSLIYGYLTLSSNYTRLEWLQRRNSERRQSWLVRSGRQLFAPVFWLYRTVSLRKAAQPQNWYERAIAILDLALTVIDEKQQSQLAAALHYQLGNTYYQLGDSGYENAYRNYCLKMALDTTFVDPEEKAIYYQRLGITATRMADWRQAESALKTAIALNENLNHPRQVLRCKKSLAQCYQLSGEYQKANEIITGTLPQDQKATDLSALVSSYRNLAYNSLMLEDEEAVRRYGLQALSVLQAQKDKKAKHPSTAIRFEFIGYSIPIWNLGNLGASAARSLYGFSGEDEQALLYTILAQNAAQQKDFHQVIRLMMEKLAIFRRQRDALGQAIMLNNLGMMHLTLGAYEDAWRWFMLSYERCRKENYLGGEVNNLLNLSQLSVIFWHLNYFNGSRPDGIRIEPQKLLDWQLQAISMIKDYPLAFIKERVELYQLHALLAAMQLFDDMTAAPQKSDLPLFLRYDQRLSTLVDEFEKAADLARRNFLPRQQAIIYKNLGELLARVTLIPEAEDYLQQALVLAQEENFRDLEWQIILALGNLSPVGADSTSTAAIGYYEQARSILLQEWEFNRGLSINPISGLEIEFLYQKLLESAAANHQPEIALQYLDELTAFRRLRQIYQTNFSLGKVERRLEQEQYDQLVQKVVVLQNRVHEIRQGRLGGYKLYYQTQDSLNLAQQELRIFVQNLRENDPELLALLQPLDITTAEIQQRLKPQQAVLIWHSAATKLYSWCLTVDKFYFNQSDITDSLLTRWITQFNDSLRLNHYANSLADSLVTVLVNPVLGQVGSTFEWLIIVDGALTQLPFELLQINKEWLNNQHAVYYCASLTDLLLTRENRRKVGNSLLWVGNDRKLTFKQFSSRLAITRLDPLQTTEAQLRAALPAADFLVINRLITRLPQPLLRSYFRLQLPSPPSQTYETALSEFPLGDDGFFYLQDWLAQSDKALFCLLPFAYDSGWADPAAYSVMQTAWRNGGIPATISLRWSVSAEIVDQFIRFFLEGITEMQPLAAFRSARLKIQQLSSNPRSWGAFVWRGSLSN